MIFLIFAGGLICLVALSAYDIHDGRLPDWLVVCIAGTGVAYFFFGNVVPLSTGDILIGLVVGPGFLLLIRILFQRFRGRPGLGLGDVKFAAAAALWVGASGLPLLFFVASTTTLLGIGLLVTLGRLSKEKLATKLIPFGPGLSVGLAATVALRYANAFIF